MNRKWFSIAVLILAAGFLLGMASCAHDRELIGITIQPQTVTFGAPDSSLSADFSALGTYLHPPETKDITTQVTWATDIPQLITVTAGGVVSPTGNGCGVANVSASTTHGTGHSDNLVIGYSTVTIQNPLVAGCPGGSSGAPVLAVNFQANNTANASVTSSPAGINCPAQSCGAPFTSGTTVVLTASPAGVVSWGSCPSAAGDNCTVILTANTTVTATFP
jgi:hypothetical protein